MATSLRVRGPYLGQSGYDYHTREFTRALVALGVGVDLQQLEQWGASGLPHELREPWLERLPRPASVSGVLHFALPTQVARTRWLPNVNYTMFEATGIPRDWAWAHQAADRIVVPTEHSRRAWIDSGVPESKLRLCPLGVRSDLFRPGVPPLEIESASGRPIASYATRFLNVSAIGGRKNLQGLLRVWLRATSPRDDAVLLLKAGAHVHGTVARLEETVRAAEMSAGKRMGEAAPIEFIDMVLPDADVPRLFAVGTHYISMSFGEGWDLPMSQAAAAGLRLIAPRHSAYTAYLDDEVASMISATEVPAVTPDRWIAELFRGTNWWAPDEDEAIEHVRRAIAGTDAPRRSARERLVAFYTWRRAAERLLEIVEE
jgi:glycosyltransferase involved in cell wall biosynthesis